MDYDLDAIDMDVLNEAHSLLSKRWPEMVGGYIEDSEITNPQVKLYRLNSGTTAHVSQRAVQHKGKNFILEIYKETILFLLMNKFKKRCDRENIFLH